MPSPTVTFVTPVIQTKFLAGGDILTITGTGFVNGAAVIIEADGFVEMALKAIGNTSTAVDSVTEALDVDNATLCTNVTVVSNTTITCTAPAKSGGTYPVVVINPDLGYSISTKVVIIYQSGELLLLGKISASIQALVLMILKIMFVFLFHSSGGPCHLAHAGPVSPRHSSSNLSLIFQPVTPMKVLDLFNAISGSSPVATTAALSSKPVCMPVPPFQSFLLTSLHTLLPCQPPSTLSSSPYQPLLYVVMLQTISEVW